MHWVNDYVKGTFHLFAGNVLEGFQPIDFYHFNPLWYDLWIKRIFGILKDLNAEEKSFKEMKKLLPLPSNIRAIIIKMVNGYKGFSKKNHEEIRRVNFFARMLLESCPDDPFADHSNPYHTKEEIQMMCKSLPWQHSNIKRAKCIGQLVTSAGSLVHGLYNDLVTDFGWDTYGPYSVVFKGKKYVLLIRHFPDLSPQELWPKKYLSSIKELVIYTLYQNVEWKIVSVGCHTLCKSGKPVKGMKKFVIVADNKSLSITAADKLITEFSGKAEAIYREIRKANLEDIKLKVQLQECYQFKKMFDAAHKNWKPTEEMIRRIKNKPLLKGILPHGKMMKNINEYIEIFGIRRFANEILSERI